jgi:hypothetical protein
MFCRDECSCRCSGGGGFDGHLNEDGSWLPDAVGDDGLSVARRGSESVVSDLERSEAGCCSHPASLFLAYLLGGAPESVLDVLRCREIHLEQRHYFGLGDVAVTQP